MFDPQRFPLRRRTLLKAAAGAAAATATGLRAVNAQTPAQKPVWTPGKPIRIIAAQAPGSSNDATARALADHFTQKLGVPVVVENKPGGVSMIAADLVARAPADGHTLLVALNSQLAQAPVLLKKLSIDPDKDLLPIASVGVGPLVGVVHKDFPAQTLEQLLAYARSKHVNTGNYAIGSGWQLMLSQLIKQSQLQFNIVNYKGTGAMLADLFAGQVDIGGGSLAGMGAGMQKGSFKPFVIFSNKRSSRLPDVPIWSDAGIRGPAFEDLVESNVVFAPANTPPALVEQLAGLVQDAARHSPRMKAALEMLAEEEAPLVGAELKRFIDRTWASYRKLTREQGMSAD